MLSLGKLGNIMVWASKLSLEPRYLKAYSIRQSVRRRFSLFFSRLASAKMFTFWPSSTSLTGYWEFGHSSVIATTLVVYRPAEGAGFFES
jgi:hypothetical protein